MSVQVVSCNVRIYTGVTSPWLSKQRGFLQMMQRNRILNKRCPLELTTRFIFLEDKLLRWWIIHRFNIMRLVSVIHLVRWVINYRKFWEKLLIYCYDFFISIFDKVDQIDKLIKPSIFSIWRWFISALCFWSNWFAENMIKNWKLIWINQ